MTERHYAPDGASAYLFDTYGIRRSTKTLGKYRSIGGGPAFRKPSQREVLYPRSALDEWARAQLADDLMANTAQGRASIPERFRGVTQPVSREKPCDATTLRHRTYSRKR